MRGVLVSWFRSSLYCRYWVVSELRNQNDTRFNELLVSLRFRNSRKGRYRMRENFGIRTLACLVCASAALWPILAGQAAPNNGVIPNFAPDSSTSWIPDRPTGDEFL